MKRKSFGIIFILGIIFISTTIMLRYPKSINPIIGNDSFIQAFSRSPHENDNDSLRILTHLSYVEHLLRENTNQISDPAIRKKRIELLDLLHTYIQRGQFPLNTKVEDRAPCFIDEYGTICAVGYLVEQTAGLALAEYINRKHQYDYIQDMELKELEAWINASGFSEVEIAMIQPSYEYMYMRKPSIRPEAGFAFSLFSENYSKGSFYLGMRRSHFEGTSENVGLLYTPLSNGQFDLGIPSYFGHGFFRSSLSYGVEPQYFKRDYDSGWSIRPGVSIEKMWSLSKIKTSMILQANLGRTFALGRDAYNFPPTSLRLSMIFRPQW